MSIFALKRLWLNALTIATFATIAMPMSGRAAERITGYFPPFKDFSVSVKELETFAKDGTIPADYVGLAKQTPPEQLLQLREFLQQRFEVSPSYVSQFTNSPLVERLLERLGDSIQADLRRNGMKSIRTGLISAAADRKQGLTVINFVKQFPGREVNLNLAEVFTIYDNLAELFKRRDKTIVALDRIAADEAATAPQIDLSKQVDLRRAGTFRWQKRQFDWLDRARNRRVPGDIYLPQTTATNPVPIIVISHGVAGDRTTFGYLAEHLASYGFAVAAIEHVGGDANRFRQYFSGLAPAPKATELLERPRDVSFVLDEIQRQGKSDPTLGRVDVERVGLVGYSLGGYTVLALAGAEIDFDRVKRDCNPNRSLNLSVLLQCRANELKPQRYALKDPRVKAIFAISPLNSTIFGKRGMGQIRLPVFMMGGSDDLVTPAVPEQIYPFTWLQTPDKYLAILEKGTHFSTQSIPTGDGIFPVSDSLIGPDPARARVYTRALSSAFFQKYLLNRSDFHGYLTAGYARSLERNRIGTSNLAVTSGNSDLGLNLVRSDAAEPLVQALQQEDDRAPQLVP
ncbi:alpha/beta hydrolase [Chamaesiphon minutus]|uniref:Putative dienelactone hydrolase n=1 Tax=Chamaesiphon minutus (strain ATCC 27169 / PCC 6605) TaxID=1173020 RepID=K9UG97_CHAP6|nr:alpha/beta hydrolase [Chamaesiphon minutus]AFY93446.1 putative dienelactone hydrolase [Chamaesiphon minutus PCC 6605]